MSLQRAPVPHRVWVVRVLAIVVAAANASWGLVILVLAAILFGFAMLGIMWGSACGPQDTESLGLICSRTAWSALGLAGLGVLLTGILQAVLYPILWWRSTLVVPTAIGVTLTGATASVAWALAQSGLG